MPTITANTSAQVTLPAGQYINGTGVGVALAGNGAAGADPLNAGDAWQIGPFLTQQTVHLTAYTLLDYEIRSPLAAPPVGLTTAQTAATQALVSNAWIQTTDGGIHTLSEVQPVVAATATGTAFSGACLFRGLVVRAIVGTPQTVTVYDALSATGTPIATFTIAALGTYFWDGDQVTVGSGRGGRRQCTTGLHVVFSGGTSRTVDVMVESAA